MTCISQPWLRTGVFLAIASWTGLGLSGCTVAEAQHSTAQHLTSQHLTSQQPIAQTAIAPQPRSTPTPAPTEASRLLAQVPLGRPAAAAIAPPSDHNGQSF